MTIPQSTSAYETHLSRLFFSADRVYKQLKPVTLPFVDFSDTQVRCGAATEEFERNQQISPDVYLGLANVYEGDELVDRMIVMRRLRDEDELTKLLNKGNDTHLIQVAARHIAGMHAGLAPLSGDEAQPATRDSIASNWRDNFDAIRPHVRRFIDAEEFDEVTTLAESYMAGRDQLFEDRIRQGWVRDGHGDLRAEHIYCTPDGPRMIDCVAFDSRLRISDALADVAFLAMDLDRLVGPEGAIELMRAWNEHTNEWHPSSLAHFYVAYRAHVRCKIACLRHEQRQPGAMKTAQRYHEQALRHLRLAQIRLVLVGGGPGTGKSTVAEAVAKTTGAVWLRTDEIRKDLTGVSHDEHAFAEPGEGIYTEAISDKVHAELIRQATVLLQAGTSVVIDATWRNAGQRRDLRDVGAETAAVVTELCCVLPKSLAKERIVRRMASVYNPSDASPELVDYIADHFDDWPEATPIDTSGTIATSIAAACSAIAPPAPITSHTHVEATSRFVLDLGALRNFVLISGGLDEH